MLRVLQLGPYPPPHGGVQTNLVAIRDLVRRRGGRCAVINLHRHRTATADDVYHPTNAAETLRLLLRLRYDIVHLHLGGDVTPRLLALAFLCTAMPRAKSVLTFHSGGYASSPAGRAARPRSLRGFVFRRFDGIIAVNEEIASLFLRFGVDSQRIRLIWPHPLPEKPETALTPELEAFYRSHSPVLVTVGLLEPEYDLELQIGTMGEVLNKFPQAGLVVIGAGSLEQRLREVIGAQPHAAHVLLCGDVPHAAALRAIADADVFLRTTWYDGDSVAVREALHLGTPVIATDNGMRPREVTLIPARDGIALVRAIEETLARPRRRPEDARPDTTNVEAVLRIYDEMRVR